MYEIKKIDDKHLIFGFASVAEIVDAHGDIISSSELEKAAYDFVLHSRAGHEMHQTKTVGRLIESIVFTKEKLKALGLPEDSLRNSWWVGFKIDDEEVWQKIKSGEYKMFSIGGKARRITNGRT